MITVRVNNTELDLRGDTTISYTLNNAIFTGTDTSQLPGSYSFPFTVPCTPKNLRALKFPNQIHSAENFVSGKAEIMFGGVLLFPGVATVSNADSREITLYVVANQIADLKKIKLNELDLGGVRNFTNAAGLLTHAKATAQNPLDYDYVFFPVLNLTFIQGIAPPLYYWFQNYWHSIDQVFKCDSTKPVMTPFPRIDYLLEKIFEKSEYLFSNEFQDTDELRLLVKYNNTSLFDSEGLSPEFDLRNHVGTTTCTDFLKKLSSVFCLGFFSDTYARTIRMVPLAKVLNRPAAHNWTSKVHHEPKINRDKNDVPETICYEVDTRDGVFDRLAKQIKPTTYTVVDRFAEMLAGADGYYYITSLHAYWIKGARIGEKYATFGCAPNDPAVAPITNINFQPLLDIHAYSGYSLGLGHTYEELPRIDQPGTVEFIEDVDTGGNNIWKDQRNDIPDRFTIYRGFMPDRVGNNYPRASGLPYDANGFNIGNVSLRIDGEYGVYQRWWSQWHTMLRDGKPVRGMVNLTAADLIAFKLDEKITIGSMDYMVKTMKITLTMRGIAPTEVDMISVI